MDSSRSLAVLTVVAVAAVATAMVDRGCASPQPVKQAPIVSEFAVEEVRRVHIARGTVPIASFAVKQGKFVADNASEGIIHASVAHDIVEVLRNLSARRTLHGEAARALRSRIGTPELFVDIEFATPPKVRLAISKGPTDGQSRDAAWPSRVWLWRTGSEAVYVIEGYIARALYRHAAELRRRRPFDAIVLGQPWRIEVSHQGGVIELSGVPPRLRRGEGSGLADFQRYRSLLRSLGELELSLFTSRATNDEPHLRIVATRADAGAPPGELSVFGACEAAETVYVVTSIGSGCVASSQVTAIVSALRAQRFDSRILAWGAESIGDIAGVRVVAAGEVRHEWTRKGAGWYAADGTALEAAKVEQWLAQVDSLVTGVRGVVVAGPSQASIDIRYESGHVATLRVIGNSPHMIQRAGESIGMALRRDSLDVLLAPAHRFRSRQLLNVEPWSLSEVVIRRGAAMERIVRGETMTEWHVRAPKGAQIRPFVVEQFRKAGRLRATSFVDRPNRVLGLAPPRYTIELSFDQLGGLDSSLQRAVRIRVGQRTRTGCYARLDAGSAFVLDPCLPETVIEAP